MRNAEMNAKHVSIVKCHTKHSDYYYDKNISIWSLYKTTKTRSHNFSSLIHISWKKDSISTGFPTL